MRIFLREIPEIFFCFEIRRRKIVAKFGRGAVRALDGKKEWLSWMN
jgi:hypothetical protein